MTYQIVPESAPFSNEQRAWLNGFLAGLLGALDQQTAQGGNSTAMAAAATMLSPSLGAGPNFPPQSQEQFPWHNSSLAITERMQLAEGKPAERRLMAAMAQLNCGSCGYLCQTYAEAIANGTEKSLTLCSPGGNETAKMVRLIVKESLANDPKQVNPSGNANQPNGKASLPIQAAVGTRNNPIEARIIASTNLNQLGSAKDTRHVAIDLTGTPLRYRVGDALGIWPTNCDNLICAVLAEAKLDPKTTLTLNGIDGNKRSVTLSEALRERCLRSVTPELVEIASQQVRTRPKQNGSLARDADILNELEGFVDSDAVDEWDVLEFLQAFSSVRWPEQEFVDALAPMRPRLYSIASSQAKHPTQVHLTVGRVENQVRDRERKGVASTMLADRVEAGSPIRVFVHPSHGFTIPADSAAPMIMVGPGTGIAPFIAFLQQREADQATGKNWLFFGDQKRETDFLYRDQLEGWTQNGLLTRLDLAFSRDDASKVYVQHRMQEKGQELFSWLEGGGHFFVCGDASRMAVDVDKALKEIIAVHGGFTEARTNVYVADLVKSNRYVRDVY